MDDQQTSQIINNDGEEVSQNFDGGCFDGEEDMS